LECRNDGRTGIEIPRRNIPPKAAVTPCWEGLVGLLIRAL